VEFLQRFHKTVKMRSHNYRCMLFSQVCVIDFARTGSDK